ncbi:rieske [2Fe-2S] domain protein [Rhodococcus wratislaviensis]|uniref:Rieske [2Fe-2S] domain protein n=1 Tax=Rhodococcus wratislaviensis TaxID=44752 RepID=A0A402C2W0_RHOWR|nr:Rieske (2Fe-2S) protein [Rhodococcus wratislaviensis]GCE37918.2 rieske [2Fe-2S] domain protein [Rhodococcus wratislaviensis]
MSKFVIGSVNDIPPGSRKIVTLDGRSVGIFNLDGDYFALLNQCPHKGAEVCSTGTIFGISHADKPNEPIAYERERSIRCPWHQWEFDIRTGQSFYDPKGERIRKYNVSVVAGAEVAGDSEEGVKNGPYVMEGYEVSVEDDLVVVDTSRRRAGVGNNMPTADAAQTDLTV